MKSLNEKKIDIIRYVSGEMSPHEKSLFETLIQEDKNLAAEVAALSQTKDYLHEWNDEHFETPTIESLGLGAAGGEAYKAPIQLVPRWLRYAAAVLVAGGLLWISDFQVSRQNNGLTFSFGNPTISPDINTEDLINSAVAEYAGTLEDKIENMEASLRSEMRSNSNNDADGMTEEAFQKLRQIDAKISGIESSQLDAIEVMIREVEENQNENLSNALVSILEIMAVQREQDVDRFETAFIELNDILTTMRLENGQLLGSLMTSNNE